MPAGLSRNGKEPELNQRRLDARVAEAPIADALLDPLQLAERAGVLGGWWEVCRRAYRPSR